ncbi:MAG TPA: hypothetical protein VM580_06985, partial [Labilithrix sp.]|nr:hypothetical protein [Labilithrix sp.]
MSINHSNPAPPRHVRRGLNTLCALALAGVAACGDANKGANPEQLPTTPVGDSDAQRRDPCEDFLFDGNVIRTWDENGNVS